MYCRIFFVFKTLLCLFCLTGCNKVERKQENQFIKPNVLIILTDDLGYGDISSFGNTVYKTPNIDKIAAEGVRSTNFYVTTPYCAPSRGTILTGRFPLRHGLIKNPTPDAEEFMDTIGLNPKEITIAEIFKTAGYATKAIGKWHLGHKPKFFPIEQGFDEYYGILYSNDMRPVQIIKDRDTVKYPVDQRQLTKDYTEKAIEFIARKRNEPFLLYLSHAMPHKPLAASKDFYTPETPNDLYSDVIKELDWSVGEIISALQRLNVLDNTIVIFMSDNGPWYGGSTGGLKGMKATTWEGGIRVPFIIRYPQVFPKNKTVGVPLWSPDILPTICALAQIPVPSKVKLDGQDITAILEGKSDKHGPVFSMHNDHIMSIIKGDFKLFVNKPPGFKIKSMKDWKDPRRPDGVTIIAQTEQATPEDYPGIIPREPKEQVQLFNLKDDPEESTDLSSAHPKLVKELMENYLLFKQGLKEEP